MWLIRSKASITPPPAILLFAGVFKGFPWILEIEKDGRDTMYDANLGNFAAIGSGKPWAQAIFRPHLTTERDLNLGKIFTRRVLEDAIDLAAGGLARPIHIHTITLDGTVAQVEDPEKTGLREACDIWRSLEREAVGKLLARNQVEDVTPDIPVPG